MNSDSTNKYELQKQEMEQKRKFNSVTNSTNVENQNQTYNVKKEALGPNGKR